MIFIPNKPTPTFSLNKWPPKLPDNFKETRSLQKTQNSTVKLYKITNTTSKDQRSNNQCVSSVKTVCDALDFGIRGRGRASQMSRCTWLKHRPTLNSTDQLQRAAESPYCTDSGYKFDNMAEEFSTELTGMEPRSPCFFTVISPANQICELVSENWGYITISSFMYTSEKVLFFFFFYGLQRWLLYMWEFFADKKIKIFQSRPMTDGV